MFPFRSLLRDAFPRKVFGSELLVSGVCVRSLFFGVVLKMFGVDCVGLFSRNSFRDRACDFWPLWALALTCPRFCIILLDPSSESCLKFFAYLLGFSLPEMLGPLPLRLGLRQAFGSERLFCSLVVVLCLFGGVLAYTFACLCGCALPTTLGKCSSS